MDNGRDYKDDLNLVLRRLGLKKRKPKRRSLLSRRVKATVSGSKRDEEGVQVKEAPKEMALDLTGPGTDMPLTWIWVYWHDRPGRQGSSTSTGTESRPNILSGLPNLLNGSWPGRARRVSGDQLQSLDDQINSIGRFWQVFNNSPINLFDIADTVHLFQLGILPIWEHWGNVRGGAVTIRISKTITSEFWMYICMMAVIGLLDNAVQTLRHRHIPGLLYIDGVWGVSLTICEDEDVVWVWNLNGKNPEAGQAIIDAVREQVEASVRKGIIGWLYMPHLLRPGFEPDLKDAELEWALE